MLSPKGEGLSTSTLLTLRLTISSFKAMSIQDSIENAKNKMPEVTPTPPGLHKQATANELKSRLLWGEPALTIVDVRDRESFNACRIMGAVPMPMDGLVDSARNQLESNRDIYVYGANDEQAAQAADMLRQAGYRSVAELKGGLDEWMAIAGQTEGTATKGKPVEASEYNAVSRLREYGRTREHEKEQEMSR